MDWHEYVFLGLCEFMENEDQVIKYLVDLIDKCNFDTPDIDISNIDSKNLQSLLYVINDYLQKKYDLSMDIIHSNYHGLCHYVAIGYCVENFTYDKLKKKEMKLAIQKLKNIFLFFNIREKPKIVCTSYR